jgi:hypothetical protein
VVAGARGDAPDCNGSATPASGSPKRRALLGGLLALPALRPARARPAPPGFAGVYATPAPLFDARRLLPDGVFAPQGPSGVYARLVWNVVAPRPGAYDFALLDREVERALAGGKRISLSVIAGGYAPAWLAERGVPLLAFDIGRGGANRACIPVRMGVPWHPGYQAAFLDLWAAIRRHLEGRPGAVQAVRIVKLTGVNRLTEELRLPADTARRDDVCGRQDETARWLEAGFRPNLVVEAWARMAEGIARLFPDALVAVDLLERNDFPPVDDRGAVGAESPVKARIVAEGERRFGRRFAVQWNGLTAAGPLSDTVLAAGRRGVVTGWQSNAFLGVQGAGCNDARRAAPVACDLGGFDAILGRGIATGGRYLEVWAPDALRFPGAIAAAEQALLRR